MSSHDRNGLENNAESKPHTTEASQIFSPIVPSENVTDSNNDAPHPPLELTATVSDPEKDGQGNAEQQPDTLVRRVTTELGPPIVVPRLQRRGLLGQITLLAEVENPKTYSRRVKWFITFVVAMAAVVAPLGSSIIFRKEDPGCSEPWSWKKNADLDFVASLSEVTEEFNASTTTTNLNIALYMLSMSIFPLWWSSFSEALGRRSVYIVSFAMFVVFNVLNAVSSSIAMLIVMRMLSGGASASVQAVGAGTIADIWEVRERGRAMGYFYIGPLCGPLVGPFIGGALASRWGWRSTMWFLAAFGGLVTLFIVFALPETLEARKKPLAEADRSNNNNTLDRAPSRVSTQMVRMTTRWLKVLKMVFVDPLSIIQYLRYFPVLLTVWCSAVTFGVLYVLNISVTESFAAPPYNFSTLVIGFLYLPNSLGYLLASIFGGKWIDKIMHREAAKAGRYDEKGRLVYLPEDRMRENAWLGAILYPAGLIWYGWTVDKGIHWLAPVIPLFPEIMIW